MNKDSEYTEQLASFRVERFLDRMLEKEIRGASNLGKRRDRETFFPVEGLKDQYITPFGGFSFEVMPDQVGINREALERNTNITPYFDKVVIGRFGGNNTRPYFTREYYEVVPIDKSMPDALSKSIWGEAVLSLETPDSFKRPEPPKRLELGEYIVLNNVLGKRAEIIPGFLRNEILEDVFLCKEFR